MSKVEELLKDNKLAEKLSMVKSNDLLKRRKTRSLPRLLSYLPSLVLVAVAAAAYGIYRFFYTGLFR